MRSTVRTWPVLLAVVVLAATGCSNPPPEEWNGVDEVRQAELESDAWLTGSRAGEVSGPISQTLIRIDAADGVWNRPSVWGGAATDGELLDVASDELSAAQDADWVPVFVRCDPESVLVDLVRPLSDGGVGTARVVVGAASGGRSSVQVTAVSLHHSDGDWVLSPAAGQAAAVDVGVCLDGPVVAATWAGEPALLSSNGGPVPTDR